MEAKLKQDLAPLTKLGSGPWHHGFELRFLFDDGACAPYGELESLKKNSAYIIPVPQGFALYANLIIASAGITDDATLPAEFLPAGEAIWKCRLRDGRLAALVARILGLDAQCHDDIKRIRERVTINYGVMPTGRRYGELFDVHWSAHGGNIVLVVPMRKEGFRTEGEPPSTGRSSLDIRRIVLSNPQSRLVLPAPDGAQVAVLELPQVDQELELIKGASSTIELGQVQLRLEPAHLIAGSPFIMTPCRLSYAPTLGGASAERWEYLVSGRFDGGCLSLQLRQQSATLQNRNLPHAVSHLGDDEELLVSIPAQTFDLSATLDAPLSSATLLGRFTLRNRETRWE